MTLGTNSKQVKELIKLYSSGNLNKAEYRARKLIKQYHDAFILFNVLGAILNGQKKFDEAIKNFKQAIKINPNYAQAENNLGVAYQNLNKFNESISCYKRAIKLKSDYAEPCNNLGVVLKNLGKFNEAILYLEKALKIKPHYKEASEALGSVFLYLGKYIDGLEMISKGSGFIRFGNSKKIEIINTLNNAKN